MFGVTRPTNRGVPGRPARLVASNRCQPLGRSLGWVAGCSTPPIHVPDQYVPTSYNHVLRCTRVCRLNRRSRGVQRKSGYTTSCPSRWRCTADCDYVFAVGGVEQPATGAVFEACYRSAVGLVRAGVPARSRPPSFCLPESLSSLAFVVGLSPFLKRAIAPVLFWFRAEYRPARVLLCLALLLGFRSRMFGWAGPCAAFVR